MQNLTSDSCSATPISYYGDEISRLSCLIIEIPILGYLRVSGVLEVFSYFWCKKLTSYSCSATPISYKGDEISRLSRLVIEIPIFGLFGGFGFFGVFSYFRCKTDVTFLLGDPGFLLRRRNFAPILLSYRDPHFGLYGFLGFFGGI